MSLGTDRSPLLERLLIKGDLTSISKGQNLNSSDEIQDIVLVKSGYIKRYSITNTGSLGVQIIYGPNDVFPLTLVYKVLLKQNMYNGPEVYHYKAITDAQVYTTSSHFFTNAVKQNPLLYKDLLSEAGYHLATSIKRLENQTLANSYQRLAHILVYYGSKFGRKTSAGVKIDVPFTHQDLADILNVTRETVSQSMVRLREAGLIKTGRHITVPDTKKLEKVAFS